MRTPRPLYEVLIQEKTYRVGWYNPERTIMVFDVMGPWHLEEAVNAIRYVREMMAALGHSVHTIFQYDTDYATILPRGATVSHVRQLIEDEIPNGKLVILIRQDALTRTVFNILRKHYSVRQIATRYRFVNSWDEAMVLIDQHQATAS
ncbi:MAG: hypothetical protein SFZ02_08755, partial [bacterium]|nr:hypothetical protein [bacterium]